MFAAVPSDRVIDANRPSESGEAAIVNIEKVPHEKRAYVLMLGRNIDREITRAVRRARVRGDLESVNRRKDASHNQVAMPLAAAHPRWHRAQLSRAFTCVGLIFLGRDTNDNASTVCVRETRDVLAQLPRTTVGISR